MPSATSIPADGSRPIQSYSGKADLKPGIEPRHHAIAYTGRIVPTALPTEFHSGLMQTPIQIDPDVPTTALDPRSRISYSELYTVQHNVKASPVGWVNPKSRPAFSESLRYVFQELFGFHLAPELPLPSRTAPSDQVTQLPLSLRSAQTEDASETSTETDRADAVHRSRIRIFAQPIPVRPSVFGLPQRSGDQAGHFRQRSSSLHDTQ